MHYIGPTYRPPSRICASEWGMRRTGARSGPVRAVSPIGDRPGKPGETAEQGGAA